MSYIKSISEHRYKITNNIEHKELLYHIEMSQTYYCYEFFSYDLQGKHFFAINDNVVKKFKPKNLIDEFVAHDFKPIVFDSMIKEGIKHINNGIKYKDVLYIEHTLFVIASLYAIFLYHPSAKIITENEQHLIIFRNIDIVIPILSSLTNYGCKRFEDTRNFINKKLPKYKVVPFLLPYFYSTFAGEQNIDKLNYEVFERLSMLQTLEVMKKIGFKNIVDYPYPYYLYHDILHISRIPYYKEVAMMCVPRNSKCVSIFYENSYALQYGKTIKGIGYAYHTTWFLKEYNKCLNEEFNKIQDSKTFEKMTSKHFDEKIAVEHIRNIGYMELPKH